LKILLVHDYGTPTGGAENQILRLRELLREGGHDARLFSSKASLVPGAQIEADETCYGSTGRFQVLNEAWNPSAFWNLRRVLREFQPDIVHVRMFLWQLSPAILPLLRDVPAIYQTVTYKSICPIGTKILPDGKACTHLAGSVCRTTGCMTNQSWAIRMLQRRLWLRWRGAFDAMVALSHTMKRLLEGNGSGPVEVIYNGVSERPPRPLLNGEPVIGYAGRLSAEKGLFVLFDALAELQRKGLQFRFLLAGSGPLRDAVLDRLAALQLTSRTDYLGHVSREEMERVFDRAWVQVIPSLWDEPFGNVATEAMMRGTAVVTSAAGGLAEIVSDGEAGFQVPPGQVAPLAAAIERVIRDRELAERLGQAGRRRALEHFSESSCVNSFLALYERLKSHPRYAKSVA
jgi:glycosyltransferase involved in cell wall biosynthesis